MSKHKPCKVEYSTDIDKQVLLALSDAHKVALIIGCDDLDAIIAALKLRPHGDMRAGLIQLRENAFGIPVNQG